MVKIPISFQTSEPAGLPAQADSPLSLAEKFFSPKQKKILIISSAIFFVVLIISGIIFYFWLTSFKKSLVDFSISGPAQIASGEPATYSIAYWNNTQQILQNAVLTIRYPQDALIPNGKNIQNIDLGNIGIGGGGKQEINLAFIGPDKSIQKLEAFLSYKPQNTSSSFENNISKEVAINGSALAIDFKAPETVLPNLKSIYNIHYKNNTDKVFRGVSIEAVYPSVFNFISADRSPSKNNNVWDLGDLSSNEEGNIAIVGILKNDTNVSFNLAIGVNKDGKLYKFSQNSTQINLAPLPLKLDVTANEMSSLVANPGDFIRFMIHYENNAGIALNDVILKAKLDGLMYDFATLKTDGFYNGLDNTITWNASNLPAFKNLASGSSSKVEFGINVKPRFVIRTFRDKNFLLQVSATLQTPTVPSSLAVKELSAQSDFTIKLNTKTELKAKGYYFDSAIGNSGPLPPKVNQKTTYTIHWQLTNYSNDLDNVVVKATLPEGVAWLNKKSSAGSATLEYNERTGELAWNVGKLQAATGVLLDPYEVIFQLALTPPITQVGQTVPVISDSTLTAKDAFTDSDISVTAPVVKTDMPDDSGVGIMKSKVQP